MRKNFIAILTVLSILFFWNFLFAADTVPVEVTKDAAAPVVAAVPVSISNGTELKISDLKCDMGTEECVVTWKTNIASPAKGKIAFWTSDQPNIEDKTFVEPAASNDLVHKFVIKTADAPKVFFKLRLSYSISEEAGAYSDVLVKDIVKKQ